MQSRVVIPNRLTHASQPPDFERHRSGHYFAQTEKTSTTPLDLSTIRTSSQLPVTLRQYRSPSRQQQTARIEGESTILYGDTSRLTSESVRTMGASYHDQRSYYVAPTVSPQAVSQYQMTTTPSVSKYQTTYRVPTVRRSDYSVNATLGGGTTRIVRPSPVERTTAHHFSIPSGQRTPKAPPARSVANSGDSGSIKPIHIDQQRSAVMGVCASQPRHVPIPGTSSVVLPTFRGTSHHCGHINRPEAATAAVPLGSRPAVGGSPSPVIKRERPLAPTTAPGSYPVETALRKWPKTSSLLGEIPVSSLLDLDPLLHHVASTSSQRGRRTRHLGAPSRGSSSQHHASHERSSTKKSSSDIATPRKEKLVRRVMGLRNHGNTCFCNVVLQGLFACTDFCEFWMARAEKFMRCVNFKASKRSPYRGRLLEAWLELIAQVFVVRTSSFIRDVCVESSSVEKQDPYHRLLSVIRSVNPQFADGVEGDAHEFLQVLLQGLSDEINDEPPASGSGDDRHYGPDSPDNLLHTAGAKAAQLAWNKCRAESGSTPGLMFRSLFLSEITCLKCRRVRFRCEPEMDWGIELSTDQVDAGREGSIATTRGLLPNRFTPVELSDLFRRSVSEVQRLALECSDCREVTMSSVRRYPARLPSHFLCVQLKRFGYHASSRTPFRLDTPVQVGIPCTLDLGEYTLLDNKTAMFDLIGMTCQTGSLHSGHYSGVYQLAYMITSSAASEATTVASDWSMERNKSESPGWYMFNDEVVEGLSDSQIDPRSPYVLWFRRRVPLIEDEIATPSSTPRPKKELARPGDYTH